MATANEPASPRLLRKREAEEVLESFASLAPGRAFALVRGNGVLAKAGHWPPKALAAALESAGDLPHVESQSVRAQATGLRAYPITAGDRRLATLVARGELRDGSEGVERALQTSLALLLSLSIERREIANETLACYREINLLYSVAETIGRSLDPKAIPELMLQESRLIGADAGLVLLGDVAASFGTADDAALLHEAVQVVIDSLWQSGHPAILTNITGGLQPGA
jgi:hypothetical protein